MKLGEILFVGSIVILNLCLALGVPMFLIWFGIYLFRS